MAENATIDEAVRGAVNGETSTENQNNTQTETQTQTQQTENAPDPETEQALTLWNSLKDPRLQVSIAKELAEQFGLKITTEEKPAAQTKSFLDKLKERTPKEQHFIIEGLGPAIKSLIDDSIQEQLTPLRAAQESQQIRQAKNDIETTLTTLAKKYPDISKYDKEMNALADKFPMGQGTNLQEYIEGLYHLATKDKKESSAVERVVEKITRNSKRTIPASAQVDDTNVHRGSKLPTLDEAIKAARNGTRFS